MIENIAISRFLQNLTTRQHARHLLVLALVLAQAWSLLVVPMHRIAHAREVVANASAHALTASTLVTGDAATFDWFGHDAGSSCDDWNAAFLVDGNSAGAACAVPTLPVDMLAVFLFSSPYLPANPAGFSLARAPPCA